MPKLSLSRAWEETASVLARDGRLFVAVGLALFVLPGLIVNVSIPDALTGQMPRPGAWMLIGFVALLVSLVGQLAVIRLALPPHVSVGEAISHSVRRLPAYLLAVLAWVLPLLLIGSLLYAYLGPAVGEGSREMSNAGGAVAASLALIVLTIIGIFLSVRLVLSSAVASAERLGGIAILRRSWALSRGSWWRLFAFVLLIAIGALCLLWAADSVVGLLARMAFGDLDPLTIGGLVVALVSQLISATVSVVFFILLARIYAQRAGGEEVETSVPKSGI